MGCGLRKLKPVSQEHSPGKIYSTLRRPQVETRAGQAYTYRYLDFLIGKDGGTSTLRLSSVRELPSQLQDLYQQGFVLAALHPFIQPCGAGTESPEHQLYRAILVRHTDGGDRGPSLGPQHRLQLEECLSPDQEPTPELIQGYVKKHIQDAADQGVLFVGFIQEAQSAPCRREADTPSLSLHSSPSSVLGSVLGSGGSQEEEEEEEEGEEREESAPCGSERSTPRHHSDLERRGNGVELLALYNHPPVREPVVREPVVREPVVREPAVREPAVREPAVREPAVREPAVREPAVREPAVREPAVRYYTVKVPLNVQTSAEGQVCSLEGPWLDHLTQHYTSGASLVDGHFYLGHLTGLQSKAESVFIFQEPSETEASAQPHDAIVVEQWTVIHGLQVKADYVPLLQSLASFGWRLTCVLPTPVIRTNSDGSLSTKQIVFLQRPVLSRKKKDSKKLIFKSRSKPNKNCLKESAKNKKSKRTEQPSADAKAAVRPRGVRETGTAAARAESGADSTECNMDANAPEDTPTAPEDTPTAPEDTPIAPEDTPRAPEDTPIAPEDTPTAPEDTPTAPEDTPTAPEDTPTAGDGEGKDKKTKDRTAVMENGIEADTEDQSTAGDEISAKDEGLTAAKQSEAGSQEACPP